MLDTESKLQHECNTIRTLYYMRVCSVFKKSLSIVPTESFKITGKIVPFLSCDYYHRAMRMITE